MHLNRSKSFLQSKLVRLVTICLVSAVLIIILTGATLFKYAVIIQDQDVKTLVYTSQNDPSTILQSQNITLSPHDIIDFSGFKKHKGTITVNRAEEISVAADGVRQMVYLTNGTVQEALAIANVTIDADDLINQPLSEPIEDGMKIEINRVNYETIHEEIEIPSEVIKIKTPTLKNGATKTLKQGKAGLQKITEVKKMIDGTVVETTQKSVEDIKKATPTTILVGDKNSAVSMLTPTASLKLDKNGNPVNYTRKVTGKATAYSARGKATKLKPGAVAMDLSQFPRGTQLYIKTPDGSFIYGYSEVKDTGPAVNEGIILVDLFFDSYKESCLFGAKTVDIYVL